MREQPRRSEEVTAVDDDIEAALEEGPLVGGGQEPEDVLEGEPGDADGLDRGQGLALPPRQGPGLVPVHELWKRI